jgi:2-succinyl-5-enolpyruvyl-6-hydroxy-3-cyclohexene-1-carboxylate synthase
VLANRGANGIDGVVSTAVGVALGSGGPTVLLIGDVAFLHDTNGLLSLRTRDVSLTVVVVDNDGGGIFSFLPQASALGPARFEHLFGTPHEVDPCAVADAHGLEAVAPDRLTHDDATAWFRQPGARVVRLRTDRLANVEHHDAVHRAVAAALDQA